VRDQDGLGLAAETIDAVGEDAAHVAGAVIELAHRHRYANAGPDLRGARPWPPAVRGAFGGASGKELARVPSTAIATPETNIREIILTVHSF
jgi:hypothetical protein